jgi:hypothetical protein
LDAATEGIRSAVVRPGIVHGREVGEVRPVAETTSRLGAELECEPGLARASGSRDRDHVGVLEQATRAVALIAASDEARHRPRQVVGRLDDGAKLRELGVQPGDVELVDDLGAQHRHADASLRRALAQPLSGEVQIGRDGAQAGNERIGLRC